MASGRRFTYSGDPSTSAKDEIRFLTGDTVKAHAMFDDREIQYQITKTPNPKIASAEMLDSKAIEFARKGDIRVGDVSKAYSKVADSLKKCADNLRAEALKSAKPFFGGLTKSGKTALAQDVDAVQPAFSVGMSDNPFAVQLNRDLEHLLGLAGHVI